MKRYLKFNIHANMYLHVHEVYVLTSFVCIFAIFFGVQINIPLLGAVEGPPFFPPLGFEAMEMLDALPHAAFIMAEVGRALVNLSPLTEGLGKTQLVKP